MNKKGRIPGKIPPIFFVIFVAAAIIVIILALGLGSGVGPAPQGERTSPFVVHERTIIALEQNNPTALYQEFSPSMKGLIPLENLISAEDELVATQGEIIEIQEIQPLMVLTDPEWNSEWAQSRVRITRDKSAQDYIVRYYLEEDQWWLFATIAE